MPATVNSTVQQYQMCIDACNKCTQTCEECLSSCLKEPDVQARVNCINLLRDCIDICALSTQFMARNSTFAKQICCSFEIKFEQKQIVNPYFTINKKNPF